MNVAVILQQVPDTEAVVKPNPAAAGAIIEDGVKFILNPYDEYAVEEALKIIHEMNEGNLEEPNNDEENL